MKIAVDLGCGGIKRGPEGWKKIGIDISKDSVADIICNLGFERIPLENNYADKVYAYHVLEHIPFVCFVRKGDKIVRLTPMIFLFNEVYRILKKDGEFEFEVPLYPHRSVFQDPTHASFWTDETVNYFCGDYYGFKKIYGHKSKFEKIEVVTLETVLRARLRAIK